MRWYACFSSSAGTEPRWSDFSGAPENGKERGAHICVQAPARNALHILFIVLFPAFWAAPALSAGERVYGPFGPEGARFREQLWIMPSGDPEIALRATVFRPPQNLEKEEISGVSHAVSAQGPASVRTAEPRRPLVIINHGTDPATREAVAMPVFYWLSRWFVERGYVVALPQRRGHGATGGELAEAQDSCAGPHHYRAGLVAASDIEAVLNFMAVQPFVAPGQTVVAGISTGGWASLALASHNPPGVLGVINFAGGRGGRPQADGGNVCGRKRLIRAAAAFGRTARIPTLWLYSENDRFFNPALVNAMARAWKRAGGKAELHILPPYGSDGHRLANDQAGWALWGPAVDGFLRRLAKPLPAVGKPPEVPRQTGQTAREGSAF